MSAAQYKIRCSVDQPIQRLMQKLSAKSPELYIFWQNYSQLYNQYSERIVEVQTSRIEFERMRGDNDRLKGENDRLRGELERMRMENDHLRRETVTKQRDNKVEIHHVPPQYPPPPQYPQLPPPQPVVIEKQHGPTQFEYNSLKERVWSLERTSNDLRNDCDRWKQQVQALTQMNQQLIQQNRNYQVLLKQLKTENIVQKQNIEHIFNRLKDTEVDLQGSRTLRTNAEGMNEALSKARQTEEQLRRALNQKESQMQLVMVSVDEMRMGYQRLLAEAIRNVKGKLMESLPSLIEQSKTVRHLKMIGEPR